MPWGILVGCLIADFGAFTDNWCLLLLFKKSFCWGENALNTLESIHAIYTFWLPTQVTVSYMFSLLLGCRDLSVIQTPIEQIWSSCPHQRTFVKKKKKKNKEKRKEKKQKKKENNNKRKSINIEQW